MVIFKMKKTDNKNKKNNILVILKKKTTDNKNKKNNIMVILKIKKSNNKNKKKNKKSTMIILTFWVTCVQSPSYFLLLY